MDRRQRYRWVHDKSWLSGELRNLVNPGPGETDFREICLSEPADSIDNAQYGGGHMSVPAEDDERGARTAFLLGRAGASSKTCNIHRTGQRQRQ